MTSYIIKRDYNSAKLYQTNEKLIHFTTLNKSWLFPRKFNSFYKIRNCNSFSKKLKKLMLFFIFIVLFSIFPKYLMWLSLMALPVWKLLFAIGYQSWKGKLSVSLSIPRRISPKISEGLKLSKWCSSIFIWVLQHLSGANKVSVLNVNKKYLFSLTSREVLVFWYWKWNLSNMEEGDQGISIAMIVLLFCRPPILS